MDIVGYILINDSMCIPDVLLQLDTALPHSLHARCFLDLSSLSLRRDLLAVTSARRIPFEINYFKV
jgi:hypothetical protein